MTPTHATDHEGQPSAARIAAVTRQGRPPTPAERAAATQLLDALLAAAADHGVRLADLDRVVDLPGACLDVIRRGTPTQP
ncbi:hypothetical protein ACFC34_37960 [Streptomyces sp. NPDC056053]|uniref:hypothetical protein n=1 Tax=Streptomyces sp. NPDC056053 TaxID=3345696 RepID=UPI0035DCF926